MPVEVSLSDPKVTMSPAACQVVPDVRRSRSSKTTSVQPISARWYATEHPITPPPTTTTCARSGSVLPVIQPTPRDAVSTANHDETPPQNMGRGPSSSAILQYEWISADGWTTG